MNLFWVEHLSRLRESLLAQTRRARAGSDHSTIKGSSIEVVVRRTLKEYLPGKFHVGTGQVANSQQEISPQVDVLIYDGSGFPHLAVNEDSSVVICCESLLAAVECKSRWDADVVASHYRRLVQVDAVRDPRFRGRETAAGYFIFVIDSVSPNLAPLQDRDRFVGVYSLGDNKAWSSAHGRTDFSEQPGNAFGWFLQHVMCECMRKRPLELGSLEWTFHAVRSYFGWSDEK